MLNTPKLKKFLTVLSITLLLVSACEETPNDVNQSKDALLLNSISESLKINAPASKVWQVLTDPQFAKILGNEFDQNAYQESDWKLGSKVYFKYAPDKIVATGIILKLQEDKLIQVDYDFDGFLYSEKYTLSSNINTTILQLDAGPYTSDYEQQIVVWNNWMLKVKALSETN
jgi:hypothetical protein